MSPAPKLTKCHNKCDFFFFSNFGWWIPSDASNSFAFKMKSWISCILGLAEHWTHNEQWKKQTVSDSDSSKQTLMKARVHVIWCSGPLLHTTCIIEGEKNWTYTNWMHYSKWEEKAISLKERLRAEKKRYKNTARPLEHNSFCCRVCA